MLSPKNNWEDLFLLSPEVLQAGSRNSMLYCSIVLGDESLGHLAEAEISSDVGE